MIVVDSSIWISYFKDKPLNAVQALSETVARGDDIATILLVAVEVLCGFKQDHDFKDALKLMSRVEMLPLSFDTYVEAAQLYRFLRKKGVTVRGHIDCLIAQVCISSKSVLMTLDKDFKRIAAHTTLQLFDIS